MSCQTPSKTARILTTAACGQIGAVLLDLLAQFSLTTRDELDAHGVMSWRLTTRAGSLEVFMTTEGYVETMVVGLPSATRIVQLVRNSYQKLDAESVLANGGEFTVVFMVQGTTTGMPLDELIERVALLVDPRSVVASEYRFYPDRNQPTLIYPITKKLASI